MNEFFKRIIEAIKKFWNSWSVVQKIITGVVVLVVICGLIAVIAISTKSDMKPLLTSAITDSELLDRISAELDESGISHNVQNQRIFVENERSAKKARALLFRKNLIPKDISPWDVFNTGSKWTVTELENNIRVQQAITKTLEEHLRALDGIDQAQVILTFPEEKLISSMQTQKKASVILTPRPGVNLNDLNRIKTIENMVLFAVDGLTKENLSISDSTTDRILTSNDEMLADMNKLDLGKRQMFYKIELQNYYAKTISKALSAVFPGDRVVIANLELDLNFDVESFEEQKILPTIMRVDNPLTVKNEEIYMDKVDVVTEKKRVVYAGTGIHPDGPGGVEGQTVDGYKDQVGQIVEHDETHDIVKSEISNRKTKGEKAPIKIEKFAVGIFIDGVWHKVRTASGELVTSETGGIKREFIPVSDEEIRKVETAVKNAVNFDLADGDKVTVQGIQFDRTKEFEAEDNAFRHHKMMVMALMISAISIVAIILLAFIIRAIIKAREAARRRREEEEARRQAAARERALRAAEEESANMQMAIGSRSAEDEEMAKQIARENPESVANLIRTWLAEE